VSRQPFYLVVPVTAALFALESTALHLGILGAIGGAVLGFAWSVLLGCSVARIQQNRGWRVNSANATVFVAIIACGLLLGGGVMYGLLMRAAADAPPNVLFAMMQPTIPYFIVVNTLMEWLIVPAMLFANWHSAGRRPLLLIASALYITMRVWTYSMYAAQRLEISGRPLSPEDIDWFRKTLSMDYRGVLNGLTQVFLLWAAFSPVCSAEQSGRDRARVLRVNHG
jgi:hypothetical protein